MKQAMASVGLVATCLVGTAGQAAAVQWGTITSTLGSSNGTYFNEGNHADRVELVRLRLDALPVER